MRPPATLGGTQSSTQSQHPASAPDGSIRRSRSSSSRSSARAKRSARSGTGTARPAVPACSTRSASTQTFNSARWGRLALGQLEARHPGVTWYTTGQFKHARGFYDRYRQGSDSPWTDKQHPCLHFD